MLKRLWKKFGPNPLDQKLKRAVKQECRRILIPWNRGLGDIALGLYALVYRIRKAIPDARITFVTRPDLAEGFKLLDNVETIIVKEWVRGRAVSLEEAVDLSAFDLILEDPDPSRWLRSQIGSLVPKLLWAPSWDEEWKRFGLEEREYVGVHVQTETQYPYEKNWLVKKWTQLFEQLTERQEKEVLLFGLQPTHSFPLPHVIDMRGKTTLFEMLSIIKNCCPYLIAPDSGVLSLTYFLAVSFPIRIVSLWADPNQGVLKQAVSSPNPQLVHIPLFGRDQDISTIEVASVVEALVGP